MKSLSESASKKRLTEYGLPVPKEKSAATTDEALEFAEELGRPVAVKADAEGLAHKTEAGLVALNLESPDAVTLAAERILAAAPAGSRLLVQEMVSGKRELLIGMTRDAQWGPCVSLALGGIFAEALDDVTLRLAPVSEAEAMEMLGDLRGAEMFGNYRGMAAVDRKALADAIIAVGRCATEHPDVVEIDVNPVIVSDDGRVMAVDALVVLKDD